MPISRSLMICLLICQACSVTEVLSQEPKGPGKPLTKTSGVGLTIRFADGKETRFDDIPHKADMTVLDAMNAVKSRKDKPLRFEYRGSGESAFLTSIEGVANERGGGSAKYWIYRVNDELGDRSFGLKTLKPGDRVMWHFGKYVPE